MKLLTKEEEAAHYSAVVRGGIQGGTVGFVLGLAGVLGASRRYAGFRNLTLPFRTFLVSSSATAGAIVLAERRGNDFAHAQNPMFGYKDASQRQLQAVRKNETGTDKALAWARERRYTIVLTSWAASIALALFLVGRNKYLTASQKLVQARMYAQGLTVAILLATATLEVADAKSGSGRWETVMVVDPDDPEHKKLIEKRIHKEEYEGQDLWMDMVASEERRLKTLKEIKEKKEAGSAGDKKEVGSLAAAH